MSLEVRITWKVEGFSEFYIFPSYKKIFIDHFYMDGVQLPQGHKGSLVFITKFSEIPGTHFIDLRRVKG